MNANTSIIPRVALGGTGRDELVRQRRDIMDACNDLIEALKAATPNGRDYVGQAEAYTRDRQTHYDRVAVIAGLREVVFAEALAIQQGVN